MNASLSLRERVISACAIAFVFGCSSAPDTAAEVISVSPLDSFLGTARGFGLTAEEQNQRNARLLMLQQDVIAQCMREAGFTYIPTITTTHFQVTERSQEIRLDNRDWVLQWGYGLVDSPFGGVYASSNTALEVNPNLEIQNNLSPAESRAYWDALLGTPDCPGGVCIDVPLEDLGCMGRGELEVPMFLENSDEFRPLSDAINQMHADLKRNPMIIAANYDWSSCMADAGHPGLDSQEEAQNSINYELGKLWPNVSPGLPAVAALQEKEISLALADLDCRIATNFQARVAKAVFEAETRFIEDHRIELEAFRAAAEQRYAQ